MSALSSLSSPLRNHSMPIGHAIKTQNPPVRPPAPDIEHRIAMWAVVLFGILTMVVPSITEPSLGLCLLIGWMLGVVLGMSVSHLYAELRVQGDTNATFAFLKRNKLVDQAMTITVPVCVVFGLILTLAI